MFHPGRLRSRRQYGELQIVGTSADLQAILTNAGQNASVVIPAGIYTLGHTANPVSPLAGQTITATNVRLDGTVIPTWSASSYPNVWQGTVAGFTSFGGPNATWAGRIIDETAQAAGDWPYLSRYHKVSAARRENAWGDVDTSWWWTDVIDATAKTLTVRSGDRSAFNAALSGRPASEFMVQVYNNSTLRQWSIVSYNSGTGVLTLDQSAAWSFAAIGDTGTLSGRMNFTLVNHPTLITQAGEYAFQGTTAYYYPYASLTNVRVPVGGQGWTSTVDYNLTGLTIFGCIAQPATGDGLSVTGCHGALTDVSLLYSGRAAFDQCDNAVVTRLRVEASTDRGCLITASPGALFDKLFMRRNWAYTGLAVWDGTNVAVRDFTLLNMGGAHSNAVSVYETADGKNCDGVALDGGLIFKTADLMFASAPYNNLSPNFYIRNCLFVDDRADNGDADNYQFRYGPYQNHLVPVIRNCTVYARTARMRMLGFQCRRSPTLTNSIVGETWYNHPEFSWPSTTLKVKQAGNLFYNNPENQRRGYNLFNGNTYPQGYSSTCAAANGPAAAFRDANIATIDPRPLNAGGATDGGDRGCRWSVWPDLTRGVDAIQPGWNSGNTYTCPIPTTQDVGAGDDFR